MIAVENRNKSIDFLNEGVRAGVLIWSNADLLCVCRRTLRRWRLEISGQGFSRDHLKGSPRKRNCSEGGMAWPEQQLASTLG
jgi:hypothetical protein